VVISPLEPLGESAILTRSVSHSATHRRHHVKKRLYNFTRVLIGMDEETYLKVVSLAFARGESISRIVGKIIEKSMRRRKSK
jgi:hypothetical protein